MRYERQQGLSLVAPQAPRQGLAFKLAEFGREADALTDTLTTLRRNKNVANARNEAELILDEQGNAVAPELRGNFKSADRAYNESALAAYQAGLRIDITEDFARAKLKAGTPEEYQALTSALATGYEGVPPHSAAYAQVLMKGITARDGLEIEQAFRTKSEEESNVQIESAIELIQQEMVKGIRKGDVDAVEKQLPELLTFAQHHTSRGAEIQQEVLRELLLENETADFLAAVDVEDTLGALEELERLRLEPPNGVSLKDWDDHLDRIEAEAEDLIDVREKIKKEEDAKTEGARALQRSEIKSRASAGDVMQTELLNAHEEGILTADDVETFDQLNRKANEKRDHLAATAQEVSVLLDLGLKPDASNADHQEVIDTTFENSFPSVVEWAEWSDEQRGLLTSFVNDTIMPSQVSTFLGQARQGNGEQTVNAIDLYDHLSNTNEVGNLPEKDRQFYETMRFQMNAGLDVGEALKTYRQGESVDPEVRAMRQKSLESEDIESDFNSLMNDMVGVFEGSPREGAVLFASEQPLVDYERAYRMHYGVTGNVDAARNLANQSIQNRYGVSRVNGSAQLMVSPPEKVYQMDSETVRKQLLSDLKEDGLITESRQLPAMGPGMALRLLENDEPVEQVSLVSDPKTQRDGLYTVVIEKDGMIDIVANDDGSARRWRPDVGAYRDELLLEKGAAIEGARFKRKVMNAVDKSLPAKDTLSSSLEVTD